MAPLPVILVLTSLLSLAMSGGVDVTRIHRIREDYNATTVELHMRTNALGRVCMSPNVTLMEQTVHTAPLGCVEAGRYCSWEVSGSWITKNEVLDSVLPRLTYTVGGASSCSVNNGGCQIFCRVAGNLKSTCQCPSGATLNSDMKTCTLTSGTTLLGGRTGQFYIPSPYSNGMRLEWLIVVPEEQRIKLNFPVFHTEQNYDFLEVYDGSSSSFTRLGRYSGHLNLGTHVSSSNSMFVIFTSDGSSTNFPGFTAQYTAEKTSGPLLNSVLALLDEKGTLKSQPFVPTSQALCVSAIHKVTASNSKLEISATQHAGQDMKLTRSKIVEVGQWRIGRYRAELPEDSLSHPITVSAHFTGKDSCVFSIVTCNPYVDEDIYVMPQLMSLNDIELPTTIEESNTAIQNVSLLCYNDGVFNEETNECDCPVGFIGRDCHESCGPNRFGEDCGGECSGFTEECFGVIFCKENLPCSCAPGIMGKKCNTRCAPGQYGVSCRRRCGHCASGHCDIYTGRCENGCKPGYYPPLCQDLYKYLSVAPHVSSISYNTATVTADLNNVAGKGTIRFYQVQYKKKNTRHWMEMQPQIPSHKAVVTNVTDLQSGVKYDVCIVILSEDGNSYQGDSILFAELQTLCTVPSSQEYGLRVLRNSVSGLEISWQYDILNPAWCPLTGFEVILQYQWQQIVQNFSSTSTQVTYSNLYPGRRYEMKIRAVTEHGRAPYSRVLSVTTADNVPGRVENLQVSSSSSRELRVSWNKPWSSAGQIRHYVVEYQCIRLLACSASCTDSSGQLEVATPSVVVIGLLPNAQYRVRVAAHTTERSQYRMVHATTDYAESSVAPASSAMPIISRSNTSFTVQWKPPASCVELNAFFHEYRLELVTSVNSKTVLLTSNTKSTNATFNNLSPDMQYNVHVYLVTSAGVNTKHKLTIPVTTSATVPDQVQSLTVYKKSRRMIGIRWGPPLLTYGSLKSFTVTYRLLDAPDNAEQAETIAPKLCTGWPDLYCHTISRLHPDSHYIIGVQARNTEVESDGSRVTVNSSTTEAAPAAPTSLRVLNRTTSSLVVEWGLPNLFDGTLRSFLVNVEETDRAQADSCCEYFPVQELPVRTEEPTYRLEVSGLYPASTLTVSVSAKTVSMGPSISLTTTTPPDSPVLHNKPEIITRESARGPFTIQIQPIEEQPGVTSTYLFLILPPVETTVSTIWNYELWQQLNHAVNQTFYVVAEYALEELLSEEDVQFGTGAELRNGTLGALQDPTLSPGTYKAALALVLDYGGATSVGYIASNPFIVT